MTAAPAAADTLDDAIARALAHDPSLQSTRTQLDISRLGVSSARAGRLPTISGSLSDSRSWVKSTGVPIVDSNGNIIGANGGGTTVSDNGNGSINLSETLYDGGRTSAQIDQAKANRDRTAATVRAAEDSLVQQVVTAYTGVVYGEDAVNIRRQEIERLMKEVDSANTLFEAGAGTRTDVYQAQAQLASARSNLASAQADLAAQRASYERRVGEAPGSLAPAPTPAIPSSLDEAMAIARQNSTSVHVARASLASAQAALGSAYSGYKPTFSVSAGVNYIGQEGLRGLSNNSSSVSARVSVPLFDFGRTPTAVASAKDSLHAAEYDLADALRASDEATATAWAQVVAAQLSVQSSQAQLDAASFAARGAELERREGLRTELDLLTQLSSEQDAQLAVAQAKRSLVTSTYQLLQTIGRQPRPQAPPSEPAAKPETPPAR
jgi:outer membrane protein